MSEPAIKREILVTALGISYDTFYRRLAAGKIPKSDLNPRMHGAAWRLNTLKRWRPDIARRCEALLKTLEDLPLTAA